MGVRELDRHAWGRRRPQRVECKETGGGPWKRPSGLRVGEAAYERDLASLRLVRCQPDSWPCCSFAGLVPSPHQGQRRERVWVSVPLCVACGQLQGDWVLTGRGSGLSLPFLSGPAHFEPPGPTRLGGVGARTRSQLWGPA